MKINKRTKVALLFTTLFALLSCERHVTFFPYTQDLTISAITTTGDFGHYYRQEAFKTTYYDILKTTNGPSNKVVPLPSKGEQKLLVLPVTFTDYDLNKLDNKNGETAHLHLQNSFFGQNDLTTWRSVSGFYYESSHGALLLEGEVAPWYTLPEQYSIANLKSRIRNNSDKINETAKIVNLALAEFERQFPDRINDYDIDNDGIVDSVYIVYASPFEQKENHNVFWAFATNMNRSDAALTKQANAYAWSSYHYLDVRANKRPDPHTYIHEVGHLLGLSDYYNTNYSEPYNALGGFDLMDYTLGDHTGLSKMLLNWTTPFIMRESGTVKLHAFSETGELLLLKNTWNESATDEYLLLEYYTPTNLNALDSNLNASFKLPKANGVKVYHVDARTVNEIKNGATTYVYSNDYDGEFNGSVLLAHSNTTGSLNLAPMKDNLLYKLIEPQERTNISEEFKLANTFSLFKKGDDFGYNYFQDFHFNDGTALNYKFIIKEITREYATIDVEVIL